MPIDFLFAFYPMFLIFSKHFKKTLHTLEVNGNILNKKFS